MIKWRKINIEIFTYENYIKYKRFIRKQDGKVRESDNGYNTEKDKVHQEHDKIFRKILEDKTEVVKFLNKVLELKNKIKVDEIENIIQGI